MDIQTIGIVGYGYVGRAVHAGFDQPNTQHIICDPKHSSTTLQQLIEQQPSVIFVCVPTNDLEFTELNETLDTIERSSYDGVVVVKSTVLPHVIKDRDVVVNPEFLTQRTSTQDFINPELLVLGGDKSSNVKWLYQIHSSVRSKHIILTDKISACMIKYMMNCFYATKICFMNEMQQVIQSVGANQDDIKRALKIHPWMGTHHFDVPGPDGEYGFGGACLPKDIQMFAESYDVGLFHKVLKLNELHRSQPQKPIT